MITLFKRGDKVRWKELHDLDVKGLIVVPGASESLVEKLTPEYSYGQYWIRNKFLKSGWINNRGGVDETNTTATEA